MDFAPCSLARRRPPSPRVAKLRNLVYNIRAATWAAAINPKREIVMSKGMDSKKDSKKKPLKTLKEKKLAKQDKKKSK
jgi:hypothetical protein